MKIIISETFENKFLSKLKKYFTVSELVNELKREKNDIYLKEPFYKLKLKLNLVDFRWVLLLIDNDKIVPIMLYLKKDKKNWENIIWSTQKLKILSIQERISEDLIKWNFKVY